MAAPSFLVVGAARAGTTALVDGLRRHSRVFVTTPKEPHYFGLHGSAPAFTGPGDQVMINQRAVTTEADYLALYPTQTDGIEALGEGSTSSLYYYRHAIPEIQRLAPQARIIVILREPVARAQSAYDYLVSRGFEAEPSLIEAVAKEQLRRDRGYHHLWHYTAMGQYSDAIAAYRVAFGPDRVRVVFDDALRRDPASVLVPLLRFIGTTPAEGEGAPLGEVNVSGVQRSAVVRALVRFANTTPALRALIQRKTSWQQREQIRRMLIRRRGGVDAATRRALTPYFSDDLAALPAVLADLTLDGRLAAWLEG